LQLIIYIYIYHVIISWKFSKITIKDELRTKDVYCLSVSPKEHMVLLPYFDIKLKILTFYSLSANTIQIYTDVYKTKTSVSFLIKKGL